MQRFFQHSNFFCSFTKKTMFSATISRFKSQNKKPNTEALEVARVLMNLPTCVANSCDFALLANGLNKANQKTALLFKRLRRCLKTTNITPKSPLFRTQQPLCFILFLHIFPKTHCPFGFFRGLAALGNFKAPVTSYQRPLAQARGSWRRYSWTLKFMIATFSATSLKLFGSPQ